MLSVLAKDGDRHVPTDTVTRIKSRTHGATTTATIGDTPASATINQ